MLAIVQSWPLYALILWLASSALGAYLSDRKGYGDKLGLASGLVLMVVGAVIWLLIPARAGSTWKVNGPWGDRPKSERG